MHGYPCIAVQDAWRLMPSADVLYGCDAKWWTVHNGCPEFEGERWSTHDDGSNNKIEVASRYGVNLVAGMAAEGFSIDPEVLHYGSNSGFQGVGLAILFGARRIVLVGFDMQVVNGQRHFFGDHPAGLRNSANYASFIRPFDEASKRMPADVEILNATPGSALRCFPMVNLDDALHHAAADCD